MDEVWLSEQVEAGRSLAEIARDAGIARSTLHGRLRALGLSTAGADRFSPLGGLTRVQLAPLVERGDTIAAMADELGCSVSTVRRWLARHGLRPLRGWNRFQEGEREAASTIERRCGRHGVQRFARTGRAGSFRCPRCNTERVSARRRTIKRLLVEEAGGACRRCGYARNPAALQFHHVDPDAKAFGIARHGSVRSLDTARAEAAKCVLLCANCHAEVEAGEPLDGVANRELPGLDSNQQPIA